jgi:hypothetical protein
MGMGAHSACCEPSWDGPPAFLNALCDQLAQLQQVAWVQNRVAVQLVVWAPGQQPCF